MRRFTKNVSTRAAMPKKSAASSRGTARFGRAVPKTSKTARTLMHGASLHLLNLNRKLFAIALVLALAVQFLAAEGEMVTVTHFTSAGTVADILNGTRTLNPGSFVTLPSEVEGMSAGEVEQALELDAGKGDFSTTFQTPKSNLGPAFNGEQTSGQKIQYQLIKPATPGPFIRNR
jgi:hypothetical protein